MRSTALARNLARSGPENEETRLIKRVVEAPLPGFEARIQPLAAALLA
jgi:hypothetical protein